MLALCWLLLAVLGWNVAAAESGAEAGLQPLPPLQARVTDLTGTLAAEQKASLEAALAAIEQAKGAQVGILLLPSTRPEAIEQFGIRLAEAWKLGRKGIDDGVILIVAKDDRRVRLEVGYGLEGALNDATAKRIVSETIVPRFKADDYYGGLAAGVAAVGAVIDGEALPPPAGGAAGGDGGGDMGGLGDIGEGTFLFLLAAAALGGALLRTLLGNLVGSSLVAAGGGVVGWLLSASVMGALIGAGVGLFLALFGLNIALGALTGGGGRGGIGGGGGGFSGGGGGFGGGGASGSW
ncbi:hypothetical protein B9N43_08745 [Denitratisoma sp. DHT3]|nr:hypothetical protein B9N43_08745 [Denitratisoma sp. DHT3]